MLQEREDLGEHELYYFDESGFSQSSPVPYAWSPIGQPFEMTAYSHSRRLNVLGFLSRAGKLVYHTSTEPVTTETVIEAFDQCIHTPVLPMHGCSYSIIDAGKTRKRANFV